MKKLSALVIALAIPLTACKKKADEAPPAPAPAPTPAMGSGSGSAPAAMKPPEPPKVTGADLAKRYVDCWGYFSAKDADKFKSCWAPTAESTFVDSGIPAAKGPDEILATQAKPIWDAFPDDKAELELVLINGHNGVSVALITGTQNGVLKTPMGDIPPTKKKIGVQVAHSVHFGDDGKTADKAAFYQDFGEQMGQLGLSKAPVRPAADKPWGPTETVVAKDDDNEKKNLAAAAQGLEAFNKHDAKAMEAGMADDLVWSEIGVPKDWNKKEAAAAHADLFKGFSDLKITLDTSWAAGDYVVWEGTFAGTNDGPVPSMGIPKKTGKAMSLKFLQLFKMKDGKLTRSWGFWNSMKFAGDLGMLPPPPAPAGDKKPADKKPADKKK
jgi:steroid delta-isomerase-like uncharacterized protein